MRRRERWVCVCGRGREGGREGVVEVGGGEREGGEREGGGEGGKHYFSTVHKRKTYLKVDF